MDIYWNRDNEDLAEAEGTIADMFREWRDMGFQVYRDEPNPEEPLSFSDLNELNFEAIRQAYETALEVTQEYMENLSNPHQEIERILREYDDPEEVDIILNYMTQARQLDMENQLGLATVMLEYVQSLNEMYIENRKEDIDFKLSYLSKFGTEGFDIDPEEGPLWDQISTDDILRDFFENPLDDE